MPGNRHFPCKLPTFDTVVTLERQGSALGAAAPLRARA